MHDTLVLPEGLIAGGTVAALMMPAPDRAGVRHLLAVALGEAASRRNAADPVDAAFARLCLLVDGDEDSLDAAADRAAAGLDHDDRLGPGDMGGLDWFAILWGSAGTAVAEGRLNEAVILLLALAVAPSGRADGLLGLAVCAARLERYVDARVLALASRDAGAGHPRALCVAGLCALRQGDRRAAQSYLATAARVARRRTEFREDLRLAQRQLLLMHLA